MLIKLVVLGIPFHLLSSSSWLRTCKPQLWDVGLAPVPDAQGGCLSCRAAFSLLTLQVAATASRLLALVLQEWKAGDGKHFFFHLFQRKVFIQIGFIFSPSGCCGCSLISDALACPCAVCSTALLPSTHLSDLLSRLVFMSFLLTTKPREP